MRNKFVFILITVILGFWGGTLLAQELTSVDKTVPQTMAAPKSLPISFVAGGAPLSIEQIRTNLPQAPAERFEFLRRQRKVTLEAIDEASSQLKTLTGSISLAQSRKDSLEAQDREDILRRSDMTKERAQRDLDRAKTALADAQSKLDKAKSQTTVSQDAIERLEEALRDKDDYVSTVQRYIDEYDQRKKDEDKRKQDAQLAIKAATDELNRLIEQRDKTAQAQITYQRLLGEIDDMVNQLFISSDATNSFKLRMSITFSILVGIVIVGFFIVAWSNEDVKKTIFSNEAGIQFITMFAIVIAVILFGIINVLESKELSALLGGLSGYILGKSR